MTIGFEIPPHTQVKVIGIPDDGIAFHIRAACLGAKAKQGERALLQFGENKSTCASLTMSGTENVQLDLEFVGDFSLTNSNAANTSIHIVGRLVEDDEDDEDDHSGHAHGANGECDDEDSEDDGEADEDGFFFGGMGSDDDDDEDSDDDDDEPSNTRVSIEQLPSDDEKEKEEPPKKQVKMTPKEDLKFAVPAAVKKAQQQEAAAAAAPPVAMKQNVVDFVLREIKAAGGKAKASDMGASVAKHFGKPYKQFGFGEKTLGKLLQSQAGDKVSVSGDVIALKKQAQ